MAEGGVAAEGEGDGAVAGARRGDVDVAGEDLGGGDYFPILGDDDLYAAKDGRHLEVDRGGVSFDL